MLNIIAHRGFWVESNEQNSVVAFKLALKHGFGIETDLRHFNGSVVISHDIPTEHCITFKQFMAIVHEYPSQTLSLNIKSDGLQKLSKQDLGDYSDYFFFDMSIPDTIGYLKSELIFYTRYSDIEIHPVLLDEASGIWFDNFSSNVLDVNSLSRLLDLNKKVVLVSPELHGFKHLEYWDKLQKYLKSNPEKVGSVGLCTDKPFDAKDFFSYEE